MKYMGSKARFAKEILPLILAERKENQYYIEPFAGGMNSICEVSGNRIGNDVNYFLIEMWKALINGWKPVEITKEEYQKIRENKDNFPAYLVGWVGFNCSYSGKWFGGFAGKVNTQIGTIRDYQDESIRNIAKQVEKMQGVHLFNLNYFDLEIPENSIIYCDPPYEGTTEYSSKFDHKSFWKWCLKMKEIGHQVFVSEYQAPESFECIWSREAKSSLSANGKVGGNKISIEKLFKPK